MAEIRINRGENGLEDIGQLSLSNISWRPTANVLRRYPHLGGNLRYDTDKSINLDEIAILPTAVLFYDQDKSRENSQKRFAYMMGLRAVPVVLSSGNTAEAVLAQIGSGGETVPRLAESDYKHRLACNVSEWMLRDISSRSSTINLSRLHVQLNYEPPRGNAGKVLRDFILDSYENH